MIDKPIFRQKTFWTGLSGVVAAVAGYFTGSMTPYEALMTGLAASFGLTFRDALRTPINTSQLSNSDFQVVGSGLSSPGADDRKMDTRS